MPEDAATPAGAHGGQEATGQPDGGARWEAVLDELEAELTVAAAPQAGDAGRQAVAAWTAPRDLGPIPPGLVRRATRLAAAQQEAITALRAQVRANRKQSSYLEAVPQAAGRDISVYLDVNG
ncbi:hypothetical protein LVY72_06810 [Arthrobacter sp. I2-34]|uniref:DUF222 domain-containing protein n=1 Tax=Arthrobacter hankyongi TaxID=2904801 RepID=A0ABS9L4N8_9MICC|nr:hypothetical protein [Arthrobacter hankyongi]MCG2621626.1 hypothetical protein [Arthrobacter hankyongi]